MLRPILFSNLLLIWILGCSSNPLPELSNPEQLTLFSIDGRDLNRREKGITDETFQGFPVLGKLEISDPNERKKLIAALKEGIRRGPIAGAKCFWPRHGIRVTEKGKTIEFAICFECRNFSMDPGPGGLISGEVQPAFDKPLKDAGIPIAPK